MNIFTGEELKDLVDNYNLARFKKRNCFLGIEKYLKKENDFKVCVLYGLRRTGKTIMMMQTIESVNNYDSCCLIQCEENDNMGMLKKYIEENSSCRYIFLDEVTKMENFINTASVLADKYVSLGKKVIMAGTDSLSFNIAAGDELFDRVHMIHTTYIPYEEYNRLLNKSLDEYIMYGGTLTDGKIFYNNDNLKQYTNSAIAGNIQHSLENAGRGGKFGELVEFYDRDELTSFINKIVELHNRSFLMHTVNRKFKSHDLGSLKDFVEKKDLLDSESLYSQVLTEQIRKALDIKEPLLTKATPEAMKQAKSYLEQMDLIYAVPKSNEVIFTQPGIRYCQVERMLDVMKDSKELDSYSLPEKELLCKIIDNDVKGRMLEDIIYYQIAKNKQITKNYQVVKYTDSENGEFDFVLLNRKKPEAIIFEVKHSKERNDNQIKHLQNQDVCKRFEKKYHANIVAKSVIYRGENKKNQNGIIYLNAEKFLTNTSAYIKQLEGNSNIITKSASIL